MSSAKAARGFLSFGPFLFFGCYIIISSTAAAEADEAEAV